MEFTTYYSSQLIKKSQDALSWIVGIQHRRVNYRYSMRFNYDFLWSNIYYMTSCMRGSVTLGLSASTYCPFHKYNCWVYSELCVRRIILLAAWPCLSIYNYFVYFKQTPHQQRITAPCLFRNIHLGCFVTVFCRWLFNWVNNNGNYTEPWVTYLHIVILNSETDF